MFVILIIIYEKKRFVKFFYTIFSNRACKTALSPYNSTIYCQYAQVKTAFQSIRNENYDKTQ